MNHLYLQVLAVVYVVIGVATAIRSYGYLKRMGSPVANMKVVVDIVWVFAVLLWPLNVVCERVVLKHVAPHLLPQPKAKQPKALDRIATAIELLAQSNGNTANRLLDQLNYERQRREGLEQSNRDRQANTDALHRQLEATRQEGNTLRQNVFNQNSAIARLTLENTKLTLEVARLTPPPVVAPVASPVDNQGAA